MPCADAWKAADCGEPASWSPDFITGGTFGFGPEQGDSADAHLPQPAGSRISRPTSRPMTTVHAALVPQAVAVATDGADGNRRHVRRPAGHGRYGGRLLASGHGRRRFLSVTNFGDEPIALPDDAVAIANSVPLTDDGKLDSDTSVWLLLG